MNKAEIIDRTVEHVKAAMTGDGTGHDWWHIVRVRNIAGHIAEREGADPFVVDLAALLHDIADWKFSGDELASGRFADEWLGSLGTSEEVIKHVCEIINGLSFKGATVPALMRTIEGKVTQDADRLDAIGAIGIARAFAYGGHKSRELHNPDIPPALHDSVEAYRDSKSTTVNHFHEKLLLLKDLMNTETGKAAALARHQYMEAFLNRFQTEWDGLL